jgi:gas vesicle protein
MSSTSAFFGGLIVGMVIAVLVILLFSAMMDSKLREQDAENTPAPGGEK